MKRPADPDPYRELLASLVRYNYPDCPEYYIETNLERAERLRSPRREHDARADFEALTKGEVPWATDGK